MRLVGLGGRRFLVWVSTVCGFGAKVGLLFYWFVGDCVCLGLVVWRVLGDVFLLCGVFGVTVVFLWGW